MHRTLSSVLFPEYRRRVLGLLLLHPEESLHGREIARRTGLPAGTITRELGLLASVGLLKRERRGNQQIYSADAGSPIYAELAGILRKTSGVAEVLATALDPAKATIRVAFVFGSVAQGRETAASDIDLMLIGSIGFRKAVQLLQQAEVQLGRDVNPKIFSLDEFRAQVGEDAFLRDVMSKPKIFVIGTADELGEAAGLQP